MDISLTRTGKEAKFFDIAQTIVKDQGLTLYDLEYLKGSSTLRVYIMDEQTGSAVIEDCVKVDKAFTPYCEEEDWIPNDFVLEVSSPGVYRHLRCLEHFEWAKDERVSLTLTKQVKGQNKLTGNIKEVRAESVVMDLADEEVEVNYIDIKKAILDPELHQGVR